MGRNNGGRNIVIFRELDEILKQNKFELIEDKKIKELDLLYYRNENINVFLGNQNFSTIGYNEINNLAYCLRENLIKKDINIYNSYLVYCIEYECIKEEDIILLERSSKYLKKHIIRQIEDIDRIFFLNNKSNHIDPVKIDKLPKINEDIKKIVDEMIDNEKITKLKAQQIELIAENILKNLGDNNEN